MWPWGHLAVGYLLYASFTRLANDRIPTASATIALAVGTQFPDLIDKPLAWWLAVLPNGRSLAHSIVTALLVVTVLGVVARRRGHLALAVSFAIGYLSHLFADALLPAITGDWYYLGFLGWPFVPAIEYETEQSFLAHFATLELDPFHQFELLVVALALLVWYRDGAPGLRAVLTAPRRLVRRPASK